MEDVLDAPAEELEVSPVETPESELPETPAVEGETPEGEQAIDKTPVTSLFTADGKSLDPTIRKAIDKIKAENPSAAKVLGKSLFRLAELDREFPRGITEVRELRDQVESLGGVDGLKEKVEDAKLFDTLSSQYMKADPAFVEDMVKSSPESFVALAPIMVRKFLETDPSTGKIRYPGFVNDIARVVSSDMNAGKILLTMERLADTIDGNPKAIDQFNRIYQYLTAWDSLASQQPEIQKPKAEPEKPPVDESATRAGQWEEESATGRAALAVSEFKRLTNGKTVPSEDRLQAEELFKARAKALAVKYFPNWHETAQGYLKSNQKSAYLRLMASIDRRVVPEAVQYAVSKTIRTGTPGAKPAPVSAKPGNKVVPPANGFKFVGKMPPNDQWDWNRTSPSMVKENKCILKDGSRVQWR